MLYSTALAFARRDITTVARQLAKEGHDQTWLAEAKSTGKMQPLATNGSSSARKWNYGQALVTVLDI